MFRIRRVFDGVPPADREAIRQVQEILTAQFPGLRKSDVQKLPLLLRNPLQENLIYSLFVAEDHHGIVKGFALVGYAPDLGFCYLDFISAAPRISSRGTGGALYERVREEAAALGAIGIFMECLPDDPAMCRDPEIVRQNRSRLKFYERYGARPIINTAYETPLSPRHDCPPFLVFDDLGKTIGLSINAARRIVRAILERKYGNRCPVGYIDMVVDSFRDDPVRLRDRRYTKTEEIIPPCRNLSPDRMIALAVNDRHSIHHVHQRGYVESPVRVDAILKQLEVSELFQHFPIRHFPQRSIEAVHDKGFLNYFKKMSASLAPEKSVYPYVFPIRNVARPPKEMPVRAGYYCMDTFTPLSRNAYLAARRAVDCALSMAQEVAGGRRLAYALVRPPGHHAERRVFGGFCYFNSSSIAAHFLSRLGPVAVLDIDYHHGNGTQDIFYDRSDVLTVSIHGHPSFAYPYFSGFKEETGEGAGKGYNHNYPLAEKLDGRGYRKVLGNALKRVASFKPSFLVLALGLDTAKGDPTGSWTLLPEDFEANGRAIGRLRLPTLVVQEGGYRIRSLGTNARRFFEGLWNGMFELTVDPALVKGNPPGTEPSR